tara:strand:- start:22636 stop:23040 length:405 start_codon:yes stop_codon:yes gene_type:complete
MERTLSIIKPDAMSKGYAEEICQRLEKNGLRIIVKKEIQLDESQAKGFYAEHEGKPFFKDLISFMTSGPIQVQVLEGDNAITFYRKLMGNTNPEEADPGTIRADFANSIDANAVHGSDSPSSASREINYFFSDL